MTRLARARLHRRFRPNAKSRLVIGPSRIWYKLYVKRAEELLRPNSCTGKSEVRGSVCAFVCERDLAVGPCRPIHHWLIALGLSSEQYPLSLSKQRLVDDPRRRISGVCGKRSFHKCIASK
jgi:hypothetical protein